LEPTSNSGIIIIAIAICLFFALELFFRKTILGKIVVAALEDKDGVRCLGVRVDKYFSLMFILGSALAGLGGVLYAPISAVHPYMGLSVLLLAFAVVIVGGMGNLRGTFISAFSLGMVMAITARYWSQGAETMGAVPPTHRYLKKQSQSPNMECREAREEAISKSKNPNDRNGKKVGARCGMPGFQIGILFI
jgi:branched-subunit amino acid ABC-type transport system permease component